MSYQNTYRTYSVIMSLKYGSNKYKSTIEVKRLRTVALKVFKALNNMDPEYMKEIFHKQPSRRRDLLIQRLKKTIQLNIEKKV